MLSGRVTQELRQEMKVEHASLKQELRQEMSTQGTAIKDLQAEQKDLLARLQKVERQGSSTVSTIMEPVNLERHRSTLIFGGWNRDTPRKVLVEQLHEALQDLGIAGSTDCAGLTTGPRRSLALMQFHARPNEGHEGMRERMGHIVGMINRSTHMLPNGRKLWSSFSRPKHERDRGSHAARTGEGSGSGS